MGMEDFGVILRPTQSILASTIECHLLGLGFVVDTASRTIFSHQVTYVLDDKTKNIEALLKQNPAETTLTDYLSIRFAICQPALAAQTFSDIVAELVCEFPFHITGIARETEFTRDTLGEFREFTVKFVQNAKSRWSNIFAGDKEEVVLSVAESWPYFRAKHPEVFSK